MKLTEYFPQALAWALLVGAIPAAPQPFSLVIRAPQQRVQIGSQVEVTLTVTNTSRGEITFVDTDSWCDYAFDVRDAKGQSIPETDFKHELNCATNFTLTRGRRIIRTLKPGQSYKDLMFVDQSFELNRSGTYSIQAMRAIPKELGSGVVKSNVTTITVVK